MRRLARLLSGVAVVLALLLAGPMWMLATEQVTLGGSWASAGREPAGLAPGPGENPEAVVQVMAARTWGWRGAFGVHTWIATREAGAERYRMHHVLSWRRPAQVSQYTETPDRAWYGNPPTLLADYRGDAAAALIPEIERAVEAYPASTTYRAWPGPNSNTFTAWVIRQVEGLEATLPVTAIGKDYLFAGIVASTPGGGGVTASLGGLLGLTVGAAEGVELNLLGLSLGVDLHRPALKLPGVGRLGMAPRISGQGKAR